jgi:hypothetical protein
VHGYQELPWDDLVTFWCSYNLLLEHACGDASMHRNSRRSAISAICGAGIASAALIEELLRMRNIIWISRFSLKRENVTVYPRASRPWPGSTPSML